MKHFVERAIQPASKKSANYSCVSRIFREKLNTPKWIRLLSAKFAHKMVRWHRFGDV